MPPPEEADDTDSEIDFTREEEGEDDDGETLGDELVGLEGEEELEDEDALASPNHNSTPLPNLDPPPSYLREISTLASWTVSSSKPGCSIPQLRHPSPSLFWQSDGPQPHYLNIHFFKLVRIVGLRLYLDFEQDESYTPTKIIFLAGSGMNDLQEWGEMRLESPRGWVWADFSGVGDPDSDDEDDDYNEGQAPRRMISAPAATNARPGGREGRGNDASSDSENAIPHQHMTDAEIDDEAMNLQRHLEDGHHTPIPGYDPHTGHHGPTPSPTHDLRHSITPTLFHSSIPHPLPIPRPNPRLPFTSLSQNPQPHPSTTTSRQRTPKMPVLRAHLVQIKILENHQNGKDTHLRGLQIFARNDEDPVRTAAEQAGVRGTGKMLGGGGGGGSGDLVVREKKKGSRKKERVRREERLDLGLGLGMGGGRGAWDVEDSIR
ncbi:galactose-binding like protein [Clathrospora elynae]|uniref:Galactose-binding like protein n=1 Tax=Clathrospora elynae TaxID=706981 RepID=A0A6A5T6F2_9PLEO|nr:galactose-binding like protein [Clathrospora elynae]